MARGLIDRVEFQFTLPCRERHEGGEMNVDITVFQFTLPCRERRAGGGAVAAPEVSIHAPV